MPPAKEPTDMAHIEHRRRRPAARPSGLRRLPAAGGAFLVLAGFVVVAELWPVVDAIRVGVTEWWLLIPDLLAPTARAAALVALPAAVAWASPRAPRANRWLWTGAVLVSLVQLARYPAEVVQQALLAGEGADSRYVASLALSVTLSLVAVLGTWALSEGLKDAGGRVGRPALALVAVGVAVVVIVWFGPTFVAGVPMGVDLVVAAASLVTNALFLLVHALLATRAVAGAVGGGAPRSAWRAGAAAAGVLLLIPLVSVGALVVSQLVPLGDTTLLGRALTVMVFFGWPLFAIAVAAGMGRVTAGGQGAGPMSRRFALRGSTRFTPAGSHESG